MGTGTRRKLEETKQTQGNSEFASSSAPALSGSYERHESTSRLRRMEQENLENYRRVSPGTSPRKMARHLGLFSIGLGLTEFLAPQKVAKSILALSLPIACRYTKPPKASTCS